MCVELELTQITELTDFLRMEEIRAKPGHKAAWTDTETSFKALLAWLDDGEDSQGRAYEEMRRRLVSYFERKGCPAPDQLADTTLSRVSRRLEEEGSITGESPARYCYITAKFVLMEHLRSAKRLEVPLDDAASAGNGRLYSGGDDTGSRERSLNCLDACMRQLDPSSRELILAYYFGDGRDKIENRRSIAASLKISVNALSIRACRIRDKLETCVRKCVAA